MTSSIDHYRRDCCSGADYRFAGHPGRLSQEVTVTAATAATATGSAAVILATAFLGASHHHHRHFFAYNSCWKWSPTAGERLQPLY